MNVTKSSKSKSFVTATLISFALFTLINPSINVVDVLPDFIGYFILAGVFGRAASSSPFFEEARVNFKRLAFVSIIKIPVFALIIFARSKNTNDNDIITLASICFAAAEIILSVMATKNIFKALFYLGQRTDAESLIKYSPSFKRNLIREIVLSVLTFGIYNLYWTYKTVKATRALKDKPYGGLLETLLVLFLPFYFLYFWYNTGNLLKERAERYGHKTIGGGPNFMLLSLPLFGVVALSFTAYYINVLPEDEFTVKKKSGESLLSLTVIFAIARCLLYSLPELLLLTRTTNAGGQSMLVTGSNFYPFALVLCVFISLCIGICWFLNIRTYLFANALEGKFHSAVELMREGDFGICTSHKNEKRKLFGSFGWLIFASVLTLEINLDNLYEANVLPRFLFGIVFTLALIRLAIATKSSLPTKLIFGAAGALFTLSATVFYTLQTVFLVNYGYSELISGKLDTPMLLYTFVCVAAFIELVCFGTIMAAYFLALRHFVKTKLGIPSSDPRYSLQDRDYHRSFTKRALVLVLLGFASELFKFTKAILHLNTKFLNTDPDFGIAPVVTSSIPWFGTAVAAASVIFILFSLYYFGCLKDEINNE